MKKMKALNLGAAICVAALATSTVHAAPLMFGSGFLTGNSYVDLGISDRVSYAEGFLDALLVSPVFSGSNNNFDKLTACTHSMSNKQVAAIFDKYLRDNPTVWQGPMNMIALYSVEAACSIPHTPPGHSAGK